MRYALAAQWLHYADEKVDSEGASQTIFQTLRHSPLVRPLLLSLHATTQNEAQLLNPSVIYDVSILALMSNSGRKSVRRLLQMQSSFMILPA